MMYVVRPGDDLVGCSVKENMMRRTHKRMKILPVNPLTGTRLK